MKTTIDIPDSVLEEAIRNTHAKTKREAIVTAVERFNRRQKLEELAERLHGALPNFMNQEELKVVREDAKWDAGRVALAADARDNVRVTRQSKKRAKGQARMRARRSAEAPARRAARAAAARAAAARAAAAATGQAKEDAKGEALALWHEGERAGRGRGAMK